ncbi:1-aminocyclopropane-1-carboxylate deaminase [Bacterioplanes sanyensis]|uniref:1-aminocyclopropane-1-carboxylate deaminase/D-cysteine desulfhydrase n=1 Tax=Bacterioplanes sanyensis TaxID=1249553 RepID=UPI00167697F3|nr:pyridoxal-phosphate dependent enzyme [Bacterioplanes sanyensis]GGY31719.1 1-aminocyclopropane-1-carboxylate deaminase [Bacterioplanes sanyensis]
MPHCPSWLQPLQRLLSAPMSHLALTPHADMLWLATADDVICGNKPWKLWGHLQQLTSPPVRLLSFGGPHSNHLHALAGCGRLLGIETMAVVRGYAECALTPTLQDCQQLGMRLVFADKKTYRQRHDSNYLAHLQQQYQAIVIPEGGGGEAGRLGCEALGCEALAPYVEGYDQVWLAVGTGTTAEGLAQALPASTELMAVNVVADQGELKRRWQQSMPGRWRLLEDFHGGGFGRISDALRQLIARYDAKGIALDPVYTAKMMQAFEACNEPGKRALLLHTGGLQGRRGAGLSLPSAG